MASSRGSLPLFLALAGALAALAAAPQALAQSRLINEQAKLTGEAPVQTAPAETAAEAAAAADGLGAWPKLSAETVASVEYAGMNAKSGPDRGPDLDVRIDSIFLWEFNDSLELDGWLQYKPREPRPLTDVNRELYTNQGAGRDNGAKVKELYLRYGDYRVGKFVQDFGLGPAGIPGLFAADLIEEPDDGYEPADEVGVEKLHVFDDEGPGWQQVSVAAFMLDRTFLSNSWPYNEGPVHYKDGGVGNTKWPENLMLTWDTYNRPIGNWAQMNWQVSAIRWGKTYGSETGETWTSGAVDLGIPFGEDVNTTLSGGYRQLHLFAEGAERFNYTGIQGASRQYLSGSLEYLTGDWAFDLTTTQRWTRLPATVLQKDELYTATIGYGLPSDTSLAFSIANEKVGDREGVYAGFRISQTLTHCSRCLAKGPFY